MTARDGGDGVQPSTVSTSGKRKRLPAWIGRTAGALGALALGGWISLQIWPQWTEFRDRKPPKPDAAPLTQPAFVPAPAPDKQTSMLGTDSSISEKAIQLVLVSTAPAASLSDSTATLGTDPRNPQTYAGGAILANGARIEEIHADRVVLALNGRRETLAIDREASSRVAMNATINEQRAAKGFEILTPTLREGQVGAPGSIGGVRGADREERTATSREDLSDVLRPQPVFENDKFFGLRILPGTKPGRLADLGVEAGDVIRSIEGKLIQSDAAWQVIDDALSAGESIVVGIERNGSLMSVSLDGSRLSGAAPIG